MQDCLVRAAGFGRRCQERGFHGVSDRGPAVLFVRRILRWPQPRVITEGRNGQQLVHGFEFVGSRPPAFHPHVAFRFVADAEEVEGGAWRPHVLDHHAPLCEGAGLVGGQDRHRAQCLHCGKPPHESVPVRHPPRTQCQGQGDHGRQGFRDGRHGEADGRHRHRGDRQASCEAEYEHDQAESQSDGGEHAAEDSQAALQGSRLPPAVEQGGDAAERAVGSRGRHHCHASPSYDDRPGAQPGARVLVHGHRFAGEHGLVDQQG